MAKDIVSMNNRIAKRTADNLVRYGFSLISQKDGVRYFETLHIAAAALCFSCELYLKILLNIEKTPFDKIHKLNDLYEMLSSNLFKDEIESVYDACVKQDTKNAAKYKSLAECLKMHDNGFDDFRYFHEDEKREKNLKIAPYSLSVLAHSLKTVCEQHMES